MPIVSHNGESFSCTKAAKGTNYIELYDNEDVIAGFYGIVDFSKFSISGGEWSIPAGVEETRASSVTIEGSILCLSVPDEVGNGTTVKFCAPCDCASVTGLRINGNDYTIVDASGNVMTGADGGAWSSGAQVALILDHASGNKAYIQNSAVSDAFTKEQALSNVTREEMGFGPDATPDDVLRMLYAKGPYKLGDIKYTVTKETDDSWALCDGSFFNPDEYPDYADICPTQLELLRSVHAMQYYNDECCVISDFADDNGYQAALITLPTDTSGTYNIGVIYSTDFFKTYDVFVPAFGDGTPILPAVKASSSGIAATHLSRSIIRRFSSVWFIATVAPESDTTNKGRLSTFYTTDITKPASWRQCVSNPSGAYHLTRMFDAWEEANGGIYLACAGNTAGNNTGSYPYILSLASVMSISYSIQQVSTDIILPDVFLRDGGYYAFFGTNYLTALNGYRFYVAYSSSLGSTWRTYTQDLTNASMDVGTVGTLDVRYHNGVWFMPAVEYKGSAEYPSILYTRSLGTDWSLVSDTRSTFEDHAVPCAIVHAGNYYVGFNSSLTDKACYMCFIDDITDINTWDWHRIGSLGIDISTPSMLKSVNNGRSVRVLDGCIVVSGTNGMMLQYPLHMLPKLDMHGCYAYVKVKK